MLQVRATNPYGVRRKVIIKVMTIVNRVVEATGSDGQRQTEEEGNDSPRGVNPLLFWLLKGPTSSLRVEPEIGGVGREVGSENVSKGRTSTPTRGDRPSERFVPLLFLERQVWSSFCLGVAGGKGRFLYYLKTITTTTLVMVPFI